MPVCLPIPALCSDGRTEYKNSCDVAMLQTMEYSSSEMLSVFYLEVDYKVFWKTTI